MATSPHAKMLFCLIMPVVPPYTSRVLRSVDIEWPIVSKMENSPAAREWIIKRNCSITPRQLLMVYAMLCSVSFFIAIVFAVRGAWYVLGFALLEMAVVGTAFLHFGRHAMDRERLELAGRVLKVSVIQAENEQYFHLDPHLTRVSLQRSRSGLIRLEDGLVSVEIGRFLNRAKRHEFSAELRHCLSASK